jgi:hypothetical protein
MNLGALAASIFSFQDLPSTAMQSSDTIWLWIALGVGVLA